MMKAVQIPVASRLLETTAMTIASISPGRRYPCHLIQVSAFIDRHSRRRGSGGATGSGSTRLTDFGNHELPSRASLRRRTGGSLVGVHHLVKRNELHQATYFSVDEVD